MLEDTHKPTVIDHSIRERLVSLESKMVLLAEDVQEVKHGVENARQDIVLIKVGMAEFRGGWRAILGFASAVASVVGAIVSWVIGRVT